MKSFLKTTWERIKKIWYTLLSVPFVLLLLSMYAELPKEFIMVFMILLLTKRQIDKIKGLGFWQK